MALVSAVPMQQLRLLQERRDLQRMAAFLDVEEAFVEVARSYSRRHRVAYGTWREVGVSAAGLRRAGLTPDPGSNATPSSSH